MTIIFFYFSKTKRFSSHYHHQIFSFIHIHCIYEWFHWIIIIIINNQKRKSFQISMNEWMIKPLRFFFFFSHSSLSARIHFSKFSKMLKNLQTFFKKNLATWWCACVWINVVSFIVWFWFDWQNKIRIIKQTNKQNREKKFWKIVFFSSLHFG